MLSCSNDDVFIGFFDTIGEWKDAHYIRNTLIKYVETIETNDIIQFCTCNASSMRSVADLLICRFPSLYFQGCVVHCLDLLLEDGGGNNMAKVNCEKNKRYLFFSYDNTMCH
jgi:hypothetical protein